MAASRVARAWARALGALAESASVGRAVAVSRATAAAGRVMPKVTKLGLMWCTTRATCGQSWAAAAVRSCQAGGRVGEERANNFQHERNAALGQAAQVGQVVDRDLRRQQGHNFIVQHSLVVRLGEVVVEASSQVSPPIYPERTGCKSNTGVAARCRSDS